MNLYRVYVQGHMLQGKRGEQLKAHIDLDAHAPGQAIGQAVLEAQEQGWHVERALSVERNYVDVVQEE